jgi:hypothetical protein
MSTNVTTGRSIEVLPVWLEADLVVAGDLAQVGGELVEHANVALDLISWHKRMNGVELGPGARLKVNNGRGWLVL